MLDPTFVTLLLITGLALIVPLAANRLRKLQIPIVVGEIVAGIAIGRSGLDLVRPSPTLDFLAEFGFAFLMFLSGLELDFSRISGPRGAERWWTRPLPLGAMMLLATIGLASGGAVLLQSMGLVRHPLLMGLILSTTSMGVVLPVLKERRMLSTRYGQYVLVAASMADLVTLLLLTVVIAAVSQGLTLDLLLILILLLLFALAANAGPRFAQVPVLRRIVGELAHATSQIRVRGAFALLVAMVVLAQALGGELVLGAFLAGGVVGLMDGTGESPLRQKLDAIGYGLFVPIFFIMVGVGFDVHELLHTPSLVLLVPLLVLLAFVVKVVPALLLRTRFGWRETLAAGALLSSRLSLIIAVSAIARNIGAISEAVNAAVVLVAVVTCTVSPMAFNRIHPRASRARRSGVVIASADPMAALLARRLMAAGGSVRIVYDREYVPSGDAVEGVEIVRGSWQDPATWDEADTAHAEAVVVLRADAESTLRICSEARERYGVPLIVARVDDAEGIAGLQALGVRIVQPATALAVALEAALRFPTVFDALVDLEDDVEMGEVMLLNPQVAGQSARGLRLPGNALILSITREDVAMVPDGDTVLREGDRIALIGSPDAVRESIGLMVGEGRPSQLPPEPT